MFEPIEPSPTDPLGKRMKARMSAGFAQGESLIKAIEGRVIKDRLVRPDQLKFHGCADGVRMSYGSETNNYTIHKHAFQQLCAKSLFPIGYATTLKAADSDTLWKPQLAAHNLQELFRHMSDASEIQHLHRIVGTELRGFLSRRFNRHLASEPLLKAFTQATTAMDAVPFDALVSDVKFALKCYLPYVFEPVKGQFLALGTEWVNSDFGAARMSVASTIWKPESDLFITVDLAISKVHIGGVIMESDIELSDETLTKEVEAQCSAIRDTVYDQLDPTSVDRILTVVQKAHEENIPWTTLRTQLGKLLSKKEVESVRTAMEDGVIDLPPVKKTSDGYAPTAWWAASAVSWIANKQSDEERRLDLQQFAGKFLSVKQEPEK